MNPIQYQTIINDVTIRYLSRHLALQPKHLERLNEKGRFVPPLTEINLVDDGSIQISRSQVEVPVRFLVSVGPCLGARNQECIDLLRARHLTTINDQRANNQIVLASIDTILVVYKGSERETIRYHDCEYLSGCVPCVSRQKMLPSVIERFRSPKPTSPKGAFGLSATLSG